tara:strand:+ start:178 stop:300 length:123 start_codon:yes stop_codon:yes gene_type:complete
MTVKKLASAFAMVPGLLYRASRLGMSPTEVSERATALNGK